jgi:hypothetical protein
VLGTDLGRTLAELAHLHPELTGHSLEDLLAYMGVSLAMVSQEQCGGSRADAGAGICAMLDSFEARTEELGNGARAETLKG